MTSAVSDMAVEDPLPVTDDIRADLVAELRHFRTVVTRANGMSLVGTVLAEEHLAPSLIARFRERLVLPRRRCVAGALERGICAGVLRPDLDVDALTSMFIASLYARHLASGEIPPDWLERVARSLWPAIQADGNAQPPDL